ncbi:PLDc N-terminal domain-containing protein [Paracoccus sediminilitoris]|uniref:PLDc N-terminal domain-containing protein n=1 Tax=Paracoccus sediminilitoris TaxID=2202419 RepID=UPI000DBA6054|nr:PLDc N-terminal domain-containing protein [Paracoccus sediminilitoris]
MGWLFSVIIFVLDVWAIAQIINTNTSTKAKVLWILLILVLPVIGFIIWYFAGPKSSRAL